MAARRKVQRTDPDVPVMLITSSAFAHAVWTLSFPCVIAFVRKSITFVILRTSIIQCVEEGSHVLPSTFSSAKKVIGHKDGQMSTAAYRGSRKVDTWRRINVANYSYLLRSGGSPVNAGTTECKTSVNFVVSS